MEGLVVLYAKLKLRKIVKRRVSPTALTTMKVRIREITSRSGGRSLTQVVGLLRSYLGSGGLESILPAGRHAGDFHRRGSVTSPSSADDHPQTAQTRHDAISDALRTGTAPAPGARSGGALYAPVGDGDAWRSENGISNAVLSHTGSPASWPLSTSTPRTAGCGPACPMVWEGSRRVILSYSLSRSRRRQLSANRSPDLAPRPPTCASLEHRTRRERHSPAA